MFTERRTHRTLIRTVVIVLLIPLLFLGGTMVFDRGGFTDTDHDGLPDWQEVLLGTDLHNEDTDGDRLKDGWEVFGSIPAGAGPSDNLMPVAIAGANPLRKDVFVEVDWMRASGHSHEFRRAARDRVEDAFTRAPVLNPNGDWGVNIHIDAGALGGGGDEIEHQTLLPVGTGYLSVPGAGDLGQGAALVIGNLDTNAMPEMIIVAYDNPSGPNNFRYRIAWNIDRDGSPTTQFGVPNTPWSNTIQVDGVGDEGQGAGARLIDLDGNGRPELVLMAYDNPAGPNSFRYGIGWNLNTSGVAASWSNFIQVDGVGNEGQGAGLAFTNLDNNGRPEMILMAYDNPAGPNSYRYRIGWNMNAAGAAEEWQSGYLTYPGAGDEGDGAGLAVANLDGGRTELLLLAYDAPAGPDNFRYNIAYNIDAAGNATHYDYYKERFFNPDRAGIYHYMIFAHDYWRGGSSSGLSFTNRDFIVTLGSWSGQTGTDNDQSGAFMHELGHNLGLGHGGNSGVNFKPNYPSIMNYANTYTVDIDYDSVLDGPLDYSHGFLAPLTESCLNEAQGVASYVTTEGVGNEGQGADLATWDLDGNGIQDLLLLAYDAPAGPNNIRYKIGYDLTARGVARRWTNGYVLLPGMGDEGQGAGVELADLDGNGRPEMIVLVYDNPPRQNNLRYRIGWNVNNRGKTSNWGRTVQVDGMGFEGQGAGIAITNLDRDPRPDLIVAVYDNPPGPNNFRYKIGWNLSTGGAVTSWSNVTFVPGVGDEGQGSGVAFGNLDTDPRPDMLLMAYDNPAGPNTFRVRVGWNVNAAGVATSWSAFTTLAGVGDEGQGAGIRLVNTDDDARPEMLLMAYDNPSGPNTFRYTVGRNITTPGVLGAPYGFPRDWNGNGTFENCLSVNINNDVDSSGNPILGVLKDWNDWANLAY